MERLQTVVCHFARQTIGIFRKGGIDFKIFNDLCPTRPDLSRLQEKKSNFEGKSDNILVKRDNIFRQEL